MIRPRAIHSGARVALVAPAGPLDDAAIARASMRVRSLGWEPVVSRHAHGRQGYLSGTDGERLADFEAALLSAENDAIWCLRGGYGSMRILSHLDLRPLAERPRPLIGFSDNTALHLLAAKSRIVTFHGPHPAAPDLSEFSLDFLRRTLAGEIPTRAPLPVPVNWRPSKVLVPGTCTGPLAGGNLSLIAATIGTDVQIATAGTILILEEVGEPAYRLDRLLTQLLLAGLLDEVVGIAVGGITDCADADKPGNPTTEELLFDRLGSLGIPIATGFPFGHQPDNWTLPLGVVASLDASAATLSILEDSVSP